MVTLDQLPLHAPLAWLALTPPPWLLHLQQRASIVQLVPIPMLLVLLAILPVSTAQRARIPPQ